MISSRFKKLISFIFVAALIVSFSVPAFALTGQRVAAFIASALTAGNIALYPISGAIRSSTINQVIDPLNLYTTSIEQEYTEYLDRSEIQITRNATTIDGVSYDEVWISSDAANKFRVNALDFVTAYDIASNTGGTYASGEGFVGGIPVYSVSGQSGYFSPLYQISSVGSYNLGDFLINTTYYSSVRLNYSLTNPYGSDGSGSFLFNSEGFRANIDNQGYARIGVSNSNYVMWSSFYVDSSGVDLTPFDFDYVAGVINLDPIPQDDGYIYQVPSSTINNYYYNYYGDDVTQWPDFSPGVDIDVSTPNGLKIADFIADIIADLIEDLLKGNDNNIKVKIGPKSVDPDPEPEPAPVPDPDIIPDPGQDPGSPSEVEPIADTDFSWIEELLRWIRSTIDSFRVAVQNLLLNLQESFNQFRESFSQAIQNILDAFQNIFEMLQDVLLDILSAIENIADFLSDLFDTLLDALEQGPVNLWRKALDVLKTVFAPILALLRSHLNLWHYVVEWVGVILSPFLFFFNIMSGTSYNMVLPIYAGIAGFIVIAIYRRFGR